MDSVLDPAALSSRPPTAMSNTPILPPKSISSSSQGAPKVAKIVVPPRVELEPPYTTLKLAIGEHWATYKDAMGQFLVGKLDQVELSRIIDRILYTPGGEIEHLHNQFIASIYANITREMPDPGLAPWVSANDKPIAGAGSKPVSGDAAEQRLKTEVMQLPARDRRRLKDLSHSDFDPFNALPDLFSDMRRHKAPRVSVVDIAPISAGGLNKTNWDIEIRKRYTQPLASESGEFPDSGIIESRMLPICYETGLTSGHVQDAAYFMSVATETFIKEVLSSVFSKTRSNGPGTTGSAGTGGGANWIQTHKYRIQLEREEQAFLRGEVLRDKNGLLPIEAKAASERGALGMADLRTALEVSDCHLGQMPVVVQQIMYGYREGELDAWEDYSWPESFAPENDFMDIDMDVDMVNGVNGHVQEVEVEVEDLGWEGVDSEDSFALDALLDSCLAIGT